MVSADTRARIERLLSEGGKPTAVARLCGVKPGVVRRVRDKARQFFAEVAAAAEGNQVVEALGDRHADVDRPADGGPGDRPADDDWESLQVRRQKWAVMSPALAKRLRRALSCRISRRGNDPAEAQEAAQLVAGQILDWCLVQAEKIRCARLEKWVRDEADRGFQADRRERERRRIQAILGGCPISSSAYTRDGQGQNLP